MRALQLRAVILVLVPLFLNGASSGPIPRPSGLTGKSFTLRRLILNPAQQQSSPRLIDATIETLTAGLERKKFTTVDLVKVRAAHLKPTTSTCPR